MTTETAFKLMISNHSIGRILGEPSYKVRQWRWLFNRGLLSQKKQVELLQLAGWHLVQQPKWAPPAY